jgi:hypothetical protein
MKGPVVNLHSQPIAADDHCDAVREFSGFIARLLRIGSGFLLQIRCGFAARETEKPRLSATDDGNSLQISRRCSEKGVGGEDIRGFG